MQIAKYLTLVLAGATTIAAQFHSGHGSATSHKSNSTMHGRNTTASIYDLLAAPNNKLNASKFIGLVNSDAGYRPIVEILQKPGNLTAFVPNDKILSKILNVWKGYAKAHRMNSTTYPPANMTYNNLSVVDLLAYHIVGDRVNLTNLTDSNVSMAVAHSVLNQSDVDHLQTGLPILIENNATWEQIHNQTWMQANGSYIQYEVGNGVNNTDVLVKDLNATNGFLNIISSILIPPTQPSNVIKQVDDLEYFQDLLKQYPAINQSLNEMKNYTLFAPTSEALKTVNFDALHNDTIESLLRNHLIRGVYYTPNITENALANEGRTDLTSLSNVTIPIYLNTTSGNITLNDTTHIIHPNIFFNNGVMHVIDRILNSTSANANVTEITSAVGPSSTQDSQPTDTQDTQPTDTQDTQPTDTQDTQPTDTQDTQPTETQIVEPTDTQIVQPTETQIVEPSETQIVQPTETQIVQPTETQIVEPTSVVTQVIDPTSN